MNDRPLTAKQQRFVEEYLVDLNATQAAIRAGYSEKTAEQQGYQLLQHTSVGAAVRAAQAERSKRTQITQDWVLQSIYETVERCKQARRVTDRKGDLVFVETPEGDVAPAYTFDANGVLRGAELAGKHLKMWTEKREVEHGLSDAVQELMGLVDGNRTKPASER